MVLNGCELRNLKYLKLAAKLTNIYLFTDPDEEGKRITEKDQDDFGNNTTDLGFKCKVNPKHAQDHVYLCLICGCSGFDYSQF